MAALTLRCVPSFREATLGVLWSEQRGQAPDNHGQCIRLSGQTQRCPPEGRA